MAFEINCLECKNSVKIKDGFRNDASITFSIIGESLIEVKCIVCNETIVTIDGEYP